MCITDGMTVLILFGDDLEIHPNKYFVSKDVRGKMSQLTGDKTDVCCMRTNLIWETHRPTHTHTHTQTRTHRWINDSMQPHAHTHTETLVSPSQAVEYMTESLDDPSIRCCVRPSGAVCRLDTAAPAVETLALMKHVPEIFDFNWNPVTSGRNLNLEGHAIQYIPSNHTHTHTATYTHTQIHTHTKNTFLQTGPAPSLNLWHTRQLQTLTPISANPPANPPPSLIPPVAHPSAELWSQGRSRAQNMTLRVCFLSHTPSDCLSLSLSLSFSF